MNIFRITISGINEWLNDWSVWNDKLHVKVACNPMIKPHNQNQDCEYECNTEIMNKRKINNYNGIIVSTWCLTDSLEDSSCLLGGRKLEKNIFW